MSYLRLIFSLLFILELYQLKFRRKGEKAVWMLVALVFSYFGYFVFIAYKRKLIVKRKFNPVFKLRID